MKHAGRANAPRTCLSARVKARLDTEEGAVDIITDMLGRVCLAREQRLR